MDSFGPFVNSRQPKLLKDVYTVIESLVNTYAGLGTKILPFVVSRFKPRTEDTSFDDALDFRTRVGIEAARLDEFAALDLHWDGTYLNANASGLASDDPIGEIVGHLVHSLYVLHF